MNSAKIHVLAIEDNLPDADLIKEMLQEANEPVFSFSHVQRLSDGLVRLRERYFDVVLLDLGLPDSQGIETVLNVKKQFPGIPIIVLTGVDDEQVAVKALQMEAQDYLTKGQIDTNLLVRSIRYAIERKHAVEALQNSETRFRRLSESGIIGISYFKTDGRIYDANDTFLTMIGYSRQELEAGQVRWNWLTPPEWMAATVQSIEVFEATGRIPPYEKEFFRRDGSKFWGLVGGAKLERSSDGISFIIDITERKKLEEEIRHMAHHDFLTGLPNKRLFTEIIRMELAQAHRNKKKAALLFLDLDRFKVINDTLGHEAGDELLKTIAGRLKAGIRESDNVARIGGDEFNVLLTDIARVEDITVSVQKILDSFREPCLIAGHEITTTTSIGISIYPDDSEQIDTLFKYSDIALYHAKEQGRNTSQFYNADINIRSIERMKFESYLRQTLARGELIVHYQPQVDVRTGRIIAAEALVRWKHPELGLLDSKQFVPAAEAIGFISAIDEWVLRTACGQFNTWMGEGYPPLGLAVNLSSRIFQNHYLVETVSKILDETGLSPNYLDVEITESVAMGDVERTAVRLHELANKGIRISIDDFGTGYSSLSYLKRLPIHRLKIDRSFVKDIATDADDRAIINAVTAMAHSMKMKVIAEGVETEDQLSFLNATLCDEAQGYLFSKPLPAEEFRELVSTYK